MFWENMKKKYQGEDWFVDPQGSSFFNALRDLYTRRRLIMVTKIVEEAMGTTACKFKIFLNNQKYSHMLLLTHGLKYLQKDLL